MTYCPGGLSEQLFGSAASKLASPIVPASKFEPKFEFPAAKSAITPRRSDEREKPTDETRIDNREELQRTIHIKNVPLNAHKKALLKHLQLQSSQIQNMRFRDHPVIPKFANNHFVGILTKQFQPHVHSKSAYILLRDSSIIPKLCETKSNTQFGDKRIWVSPAPTDPKTFSLYDRAHTIFVGRLPLRYSEEDIYHLFSPIGDIRNVRLVRDSVTKTSKGFGFVYFESKTSVSQAIQIFKKKLVDGHPLRVVKAEKESQLREHEQEQGKENEKSHLHKTTPSILKSRPNQSQKKPDKKSIRKVKARSMDTDKRARKEKMLKCKRSKERK